MAHLITAIDKTYSIRSKEWHGMANIPLHPDGTPVDTLTREHLTDIFHPIIPLPDLASDGPAFTGEIPLATLHNIQAMVSVGDIHGAFFAARSALYPDRVELTDWKGVAADMRHTGGSLVPLAIHSDGYKEIENGVFWNAKERALANTLHVVTTAGTLDGCKRFYICIELPGANFSAAGEAFRDYLCLVTSHDGTMAAQAFISRTRIVCNNTFTAADANARARVAVRHTKNADAEMIGLEKFILEAMEGRVVFQTNYQKAKETSLSPDKAMAALTGYFYGRTVGRKNDTTGKAGNARLSTRARNQIQEIFQAFQFGLGNDGKNVADLLNGFTEHYTSGSGTGVTKEGREITPLEKKSASEWGSAADTKTEIVRLLLQPDGTALQELVRVGESKGIDAYLEGTGTSRAVFIANVDRPIRPLPLVVESAPAPAPAPAVDDGPQYLTGLERSRAVSGNYGERKSPVMATPDGAPWSGGFDLDAMLDKPIK